jgi:hypothetical protein
MIVLGVGRGLTSLSSKTERPPKFQPPEITVPKFPPPNPPGPNLGKDQGRRGPWKEDELPPEIRKRLEENRRRAQQIAEELRRRQKLRPGPVEPPPAADDNDGDADDRLPPGKTPP